MGRKYDGWSASSPERPPSPRLSVRLVTALLIAPLTRYTHGALPSDIAQTHRTRQYTETAVLAADSPFPSPSPMPHLRTYTCAPAATIATCPDQTQPHPLTQPPTDAPPQLLLGPPIDSLPSPPTHKYLFSLPPNASVLNSFRSTYIMLIIRFSISQFLHSFIQSALNSFGILPFLPFLHTLFLSVSVSVCDHVNVYGFFTFSLHSTTTTTTTNTTTATYTPLVHVHLFHAHLHTSPPSFSPYSFAFIRFFILPLHPSILPYFLPSILPSFPPPSLLSFFILSFPLHCFQP
ncbi:hypothetical protein TcWFU_004038 [Taenia crassiceps]|uniref:Uncharacterized protein n=1 Tax=Taenia crassiceps TaxID=6207 RepID=A0ABR4Q8R1_9CEST